MPRSKATSTPDRFPPSPQLQYRFVGGKGGVGKTTCAAAMGVVLARDGFRTLVISTDPAPSLADALGQPVGPRPKAVRGVRGLQAVEVNGVEALGRWVESRRATLENIALRGTWLDRDDVSRLLRLSLPGIDEVAGLLQIVEFGRDRAYDRIIVDTAPTGHLMRMLGIPAVLQGLARVFDHMQAKHRIMVDALRGAWTPDAADELIEEISRDAGAMHALLRDPARTQLSWVTLPEPMAIEESADGIRWLSQHGIAVDGVIVNRVTRPPPQPCRWCSARRQGEQQAIDRLRQQTARSIHIGAVFAVGREPRGIEALATIGRHLRRAPRVSASRTRRATSRVAAVLPASAGPVSAATIATPGTRLLMFGGKGGVGKTTCAAATALDIALSNPKRRLLLLSTDPAHSVGDALDQSFSDAPGSIRGGPANLMVRELDAQRVFRELRDRFSAAIEDLFARVSGPGMGDSLASHDRQVMRDLLELAPPGVDELVAIVEVTDTLAAKESIHDLVVMDTAPTGHALRLLEMPSLVHGWVKAVMAILLKYQPIVGVGDLGAVLLRFSQGLGRLRDVLSDAHRTRFVAVTRPATLPRAETLRLLERLDGVSIDAPVIVVNAVGTGTCSRCRTDLTAQKREIAALQKALAGSSARRRELLIGPAEIPPPRGRASLAAWRARWRDIGKERF